MCNRKICFQMWMWIGEISSQIFLRNEHISAEKSMWGRMPYSQVCVCHRERYPQTFKCNSTTYSQICMWDKEIYAQIWMCSEEIYVWNIDIREISAQTSMWKSNDLLSNVRGA